MDEDLTRQMYNRDESYISDVLRIRYYPMCAVSGFGAIIRDDSGKEYIDFEAGGGVANTGYCHPEIVRAVTDQVSRLSHNSVIISANDKAISLAEKLIEITPGNYQKKVWFGLSGSDANDCIYKIVKLYTRRSKIVTFIGSYHGQTMGALSMSGLKVHSQFTTLSDVIKVPFPYCYRCPFKIKVSQCSLNCLDYLEEYLFETVCPPEDIAAFVIEAIQGDSGVIVPPPGYFERLAKICNKHGILIVADEVLSGLGRTGKMYAFEHFGILPDLVVIGKALGSGIPISAIVGKAEIIDCNSGVHYLTLGGNPVGCAAALTTIRLIEKYLMKRVPQISTMILKGLSDIKNKHYLIGDIRGKGLMIGVEIVDKKGHPGRKEAQKICYSAWANGLIMVTLGLYGNVIRINPPLVIEEKEVLKALRIFDLSLGQVEKGEVLDENIESFNISW